MSQVPITSTTAKGVKGMNLPQKQKLASGIVLKDHNDLLILTHRGTIKRINVMDIPKKKRTNKGVQIYKIVKSNPFMITDLCLMNATQYKQRAKIRVNTTKTVITINAFDIKIDRTGNGKSFIKPRFGKPLYMNIEELLVDDSITPLSEYVKDQDTEIIQQKLFD
jgi:topoisomerase-4 subunit A